MSIALKSALKIALLFLIGITFLYVAFRGQDLQNIWLEVKVANLFWVLVSVLCTVAANVIRALRWQMLYNSIDYKVSFLNALFAGYIGYLSNLALPRFGELMRCKALERQENIPLFASIGTVITERLFDVLVLFLAGLGMLFFQFQLVDEFLAGNVYQNFLEQFSIKHIYLALGIIFLLLLVLLLFVYLKGRFKRKLLRIYSALKQGLTSYQKLKRKPLFLSYSFGIWMLYLLAIFAAFFSLESTSHLGLNTAFTAVVFSGLAMAVPVQGGIGVFHWMMAKCLMLYGIAFADGLAYATIIYGVQLLPILLFGTIGFGILFKNKPE
ncbi:MAG: flippase-like domain-containing protein [Pedobacter sp.]|nr:flippase-like domain-containing protein [Pedobacter sp.]